ncbi:hypothetical protein HYPSUDRAFT_221573 [Hypholoma sublateritium FD-334 SS-4]|uniref:Uncharacterized protein n=1 Tax=Hypholoma sublateritium (strain FD-334 SS-4) TaxID=945553 RepID=A0A0D2MZI2_HYPSF|nr:hypothetical protein HYPSUDRAFT_221573 [Hypholoma sublateritium FD-334 SS-4]
MRTSKYHRTAVRGSQSRCYSARFLHPRWAPQVCRWVGGCARRRAASGRAAPEAALCIWQAVLEALLGGRIGWLARSVANIRGTERAATTPGPQYSIDTVGEAVISQGTESGVPLCHQTASHRAQALSDWGLLIAAHFILQDAAGEPAANSVRATALAAPTCDQVPTHPPKVQLSAITIIFARGAGLQGGPYLSHLTPIAQHGDLYVYVHASLRLSNQCVRRRLTLIRTIIAARGESRAWCCGGQW